MNGNEKHLAAQSSPKLPCDSFPNNLLTQAKQTKIMENKTPDVSAGDPPKQNELSVLLDEIEQRANAATQGPWEFWEGGLVIIPSTQKGVPGKIVFAASSWCEEDKCSPEEFKNCIFAASSRTDVPALVKALRRAEMFVQMIEDTTPQWRDSAASLKQELAAILTQTK